MNKNSLILALLLLLPCAPARALSVPAGSSLAVLTLPDGFRVSAELALTAAQQARGLMFREELAPGSGMLFVFGPVGPRSFWMKNTYIDLDIVFLDEKLKVLKIFHRVPRSAPEQPEAEVARVFSPAACVLELPAGTAREHRLKPGAVLKIAFSPPAVNNERKKPSSSRP